MRLCLGTGEATNQPCSPCGQDKMLAAACCNHLLPLPGFPRGPCLSPERAPYLGSQCIGRAGGHLA